MALRPVFVPNLHGRTLVAEVPIEFTWFSGMADVQRRKSVRSLHEQAKCRNLTPLLEISTKSEEELGRRLSAFSLRIELDGRKIFFENAYQGSKVFVQGGPYVDLYDMDPWEAKKDIRLRESGRIVSFRFDGQDFPTFPATVFYDWLYISTLYEHRTFLKRIHAFAGFTDIAYNPERSLNCQARSCALLVALELRGLLDEAMTSFQSFRNILISSNSASSFSPTVETDHWVTEH